MANIDEKRITGVSDTDVTIPIRWSAKAKDLRWNNAIAMGVTIARTIDKMNLWDGYLHFKERVPAHSLNLGLFKTSDISAELNTNIQRGVSFVFNEVVPYHSMSIGKFATSNISAILPSKTIRAYAEGDTVIYIEMYNPIYSEDISANTSAFQITATFGSSDYTILPTNVELVSHNLLKLTLDNFAQAVGEITILYMSEKGNIKNNSNGEPVGSFNIAFTYTITYTEGE